MRAFTFIECFAGVGGFRLGLEALGGRCVWACEVDGNAAMAYEANHGDVPYHDVRAADPSKIPPYEVLTGGFPCQDFTGAGEQRGLEGQRGALFFELVRIVRATRPRLIFLENVKGLVTMEGGSTMRRVLAALEELGYACRYGLRNCDGVLPQFRRRVYLLGFRDAAAAARFEMPASPTLSPPPTMRDVLEPSTDPFLRAFTLSRPAWRRVKASKTTAKYGLSSRLLGPADVADTLLSLYRTSAQSSAQFVAKPDGRPEGKPEGGGGGGEGGSQPPRGGLEEVARAEVECDAVAEAEEKEAEEEAAAEAAAAEEEDAESCRPRWMTPRECCRLMGFPEALRLHPQPDRNYALLGNAVVPPLVALIGGAALAALDEDPTAAAAALHGGIRAMARLLELAAPPGLVGALSARTLRVHVPARAELATATHVPPEGAASEGGPLRGRELFEGRLGALLDTRLDAGGDGASHQHEHSHAHAHSHGAPPCCTGHGSDVAAEHAACA